MINGQDKLTVYVPIISNPQRTSLAQFRVALVDAASHRGDGGAPSAHATSPSRAVASSRGWR